MGVHIPTFLRRLAALSGAAGLMACPSAATMKPLGADGTANIPSQLLDIDGDGQPDGLGMDLNGDGIPDALDTNGDGQADMFNPEALGLPPGAFNRNGDPQIAMPAPYSGRSASPWSVPDDYPFPEGELSTDDFKDVEGCFDVPITLNHQVERWMRYFQSPSGRKSMARYMEGYRHYGPQMREILASKGLPQDLVFLSMIESGFNPNARSHAGAVGAWQFMPATGRQYGMAVNSYQDQRRDPLRSTHAAADFLGDLHDNYGNWPTAMAGYNAGEGRVNAATRRADSRNFWNAQRFLPRETQDYVPKFMAAALIGKYGPWLGFGNLPEEEPDSATKKCIAKIWERNPKLRPEWAKGPQPGLKLPPMPDQMCTVDDLSGCSSLADIAAISSMYDQP